jgi:hypothetical protein
MARYLECARIYLYKQIVHHAGRVMLRPLRVETGTVRHRAGIDACDFQHLARGHDRDGRGDHVAVQIEIDGVKKLAVRRDIHRRRKKPQRDLPDDFVVLR